MVIQHNLPAMNSHRQLSVNNKATSKNLEKLSSGYRINRAADDAAGLAISEKMRGQIRGLEMATSNAQNGVALIQTAEGGLNETHSILQRMRELAVQSSNGTYHDDVDRENLQKEFHALKSEIDRISSSTHYNGINLLDGTAGCAIWSFQNTITDEMRKIFTDIGFYQTSFDWPNGIDVEPNKLVSDFRLVISKNENGAKIVLQSEGEIYAIDDDNRTFKDESGNIIAELDFSFKESDVKHNGVIFFQRQWDFINNIYLFDCTKVAYGESKITFQIGANGTDDQRVGLHIGDMSTATLGDSKTGTLLCEASIDTLSNANEAIQIVDGAINQVSGTRADLGALQNRLEHTVNNLGVTTENLQAAESSIRDVDMAKEMMEFTQNNILIQAAQAMLAQANQLPQGVLQLLR